MCVCVYAMNIHENMPWTALDVLAGAHLGTSLQKWAVTGVVPNQQEAQYTSLEHGNKLNQLI